MDIKDVDKWFSSKVYDKEHKERATITKLAKVKNKDILVVGLYGALAISPNLLKYVKSITAIHPSKIVMRLCRGKSKRIKCRLGNIRKLPFKDESFDAIISPWAGLHYQKNKSQFLKEFHRVLKRKGILLIEEADETSEYVKILNAMAPKRKEKIKDSRKELLNEVEKLFRVQRYPLTTYYDFKNSSQFKGYFRKEIVFDEKKQFTRKMERILEAILRKKKNLKVQEKSIFFICKK